MSRFIRRQSDSGQQTNLENRHNVFEECKFITSSPIGEKSPKINKLLLKKEFLICFETGQKFLHTTMFYFLWRRDAHRYNGISTAVAPFLKQLTFIPRESRSCIASSAVRLGSSGYVWWRRSSIRNITNARLLMHAVAPDAVCRTSLLFRLSMEQATCRQKTQIFFKQRRKWRHDVRSLLFHVTHHPVCVVDWITWETTTVISHSSQLLPSCIQIVRNCLIVSILF